MPSHRADVVGIGASSVDLVFRVPVYPTPHGDLSKVPILSHRVSCGGQTATTLCTCASLGLTSLYVGTMGSDQHARLMRETLDGRGVDTRHALVRDGAHPYAVIVIAEDSGERVVLWRREPALALHPLDGLCQRHPRAGDRGGARAAVRLDHVAVVGDLPLAERHQVWTRAGHIVPREPGLVGLTCQWERR